MRLFPLDVVRSDGPGHELQGNLSANSQAKPEPDRLSGSVRTFLYAPRARLIARLRDDDPLLPLVDSSKSESDFITTKAHHDTQNMTVDAAKSSSESVELIRDRVRDDTAPNTTQTVNVAGSAERTAHAH